MLQVYVRMSLLKLEQCCSLRMSLTSTEQRGRGGGEVGVIKKIKDQSVCWVWAYLAHSKLQVYVRLSLLISEQCYSLRMSLTSTEQRGRGVGEVGVIKKNKRPVCMLRMSLTSTELRRQRGPRERLEWQWGSECWVQRWTTQFCQITWTERVDMEKAEFLSRPVLTSTHGPRVDMEKAAFLSRSVLTSTHLRQRCQSDFSAYTS